MLSLKQRKQNKTKQLAMKIQQHHQKVDPEKLSKILATLITSQNPAETKPERNTRGRPKKVQPQQKRHTLTMDLIINKLLQTETYFNSYLTQRSSRWILEEDKGQFVKKI